MDRKPLPWARPADRRKPQAGTPIERCPADLAAFLTEFYESNDIIFGLAEAEVEANVSGDNSAYIAWVGVRRGGPGVGTAMMMFICGLADRHGTRLELLVRPKATEARTPMSTETLIAWYERFGFVDKPWGSYGRLFRAAR